MKTRLILPGETPQKTPVMQIRYWNLWNKAGSPRPVITGRMTGSGGYLSLGEAMAEPDECYTRIAVIETIEETEQ